MSRDLYGAPEGYDAYAEPGEHWPPRRNWGSYLGIMAGFFMVFVIGIAFGSWPGPTREECTAAWNLLP